MTRSRNSIVFATAVVIGLLMVRGTTAGAAEDAASAKKLQVAVVTGGHPFNEQEFFKLFEGYDDIAYKHLPQKTGGEMCDDIAGWPYDVIVLYNFNQQIMPKQQENFVKLLDKGVGLVILHHANDAYMQWPLYHEISGVESHFSPWTQNGVPMATAGFKGGVKYRVHVVDATHPITRGLADYDMVDETYCGRSFSPENHVLLTIDESSSDKTVGWTKTYRNARVCYLQAGHDETAYRNPNYRTLIVRAVRWTAP